MSVQVTEPVATRGGKDIVFFNIEGPTGLRMQMTNYGGVIIKLLTADKDGQMVDVVLGFDSIDDYFTRSPKCGALIGRYANRIDDSSFDLNGVHYALEPSRDGYTIHGGPHGFDKAVFDWEIMDDASVKLSITSPDGEAGFPGTLMLEATYRLTTDNALDLSYVMRADAETPVNITNHSYFNLSGAGNGSIEDHIVMIDSDMFCEADQRGVPTGTMLSVEETPMDFRTPRRVGEVVESEFQQLRQFDGYDHSYELGDNVISASAWSPVTGIRMDVITTMPAVQFYTSNGMNIENAKGGKRYAKRAGLCFETQFHPDSPNHPNFPSSILPQNKWIEQTTRYKFSVQLDPPGTSVLPR